MQEFKDKASEKGSSKHVINQYFNTSILRFETFPTKIEQSKIILIRNKIQS